MGTTGRDGLRPRVVVAVTTPITAATFYRGQLRWLRQRGFELTLVSAPGEMLESLGAREGVAVAGLPMAREINARADIASLRQFVALLRRLRPELTHVSTPKAGLIGGAAAFLTRVPSRVYTLRGLRLETVGGFPRIVLWIAEFIACRSAHVVVAVSPSLAKRATDLKLVSRRNVVVIGRGSSNGVDAERFMPTASARRQAEELRVGLGISPDAPVVGFVGRLSPDKGLRELFMAFAVVHRQLPAARLLLAGDIDCEPGLLARIGADIQDSAVVRTGWLEDPCVAYHTIDVLALPTHREGFPNVALEAAAAGLPVVTTTATGATDSVRDGVTGILVPPRDPQALAEAILRLLRDPAEAARFGEAGRAWVREEFNPTHIWEGIAHVYDCLLEDRGKRGFPPSRIRP